MGFSAPAAKQAASAPIADDSWWPTAYPLLSPVPGVTPGATSGPLVPLGRPSGSLPRARLQVVRQPWESAGALLTHWKYFNASLRGGGWGGRVRWVWPGQQKTGTSHHQQKLSKNKGFDDKRDCQALVVFVSL